MRFFYNLLPTILLIAAYFTSTNINQLSPLIRESIDYIPYALITIGVLFGLKFNRSRIFYYLPILGLFYWAHGYYLTGTQNNFSAQAIRYTLYYLLPLNTLIFFLFKERGIYSIHGLARMLIVLIQTGLIFWVVAYQQTWVLDAAIKGIIQKPLPAMQALPPTILLILVAGFILITAKNIFFYKSPIDAGFFGAYAAATFALYFIDDASAFTLYIAAAALILSISIIQDSHHMAYRDELTGLMGRRALNEYMMGLGRSYTIAMLDVDHFKKFNDTHGHDVGDQVLKMVGKQIMEITGGGKAFRYGGEEFTIVFPRKRIEKTVPHLEALREGIAAYELQIRSKGRPKKNSAGKKLRAQKAASKTVSVKISIGVAQRDEKAKTPEDVIKQSDKALYRAKKKGRNCLSK